MVPNAGPYDAQANIDAVSLLFDKIGRGILVTHSQSGGPGWRTAIKNNNVKADVAWNLLREVIWNGVYDPEVYELAAKIKNAQKDDRQARFFLEKAKKFKRA